MVNPVQDSKLFFTPVSGFVSASGLGFGDTVGFGVLLGLVTVMERVLRMEKVPALVYMYSQKKHEQSASSRSLLTHC